MTMQFVIIPSRASESNPDGPSTRGIHSQVDAPLIDLLTKTVKLDSDRKGQADVADFMSVASNDAKTVSVLQNELGLIFKTHPTRCQQSIWRTNLPTETPAVAGEVEEPGTLPET
ncbi:MAG TPA: hypothetical protein VEU98_08840 [Candidatus Eremiobacteraceae bacterium]|nr:hypothetical protein [Candidatus Eremiobacteraceae bacterium]